MDAFWNSSTAIFNRLTKIRGGAHEAIIGEWIRLWNDLNPDNMVINPAPLVEGRVSDILFLEPEYETIDNIQEPNYWKPAGVAEIENNIEKWNDKVRSLVGYIETYPIHFVLLCVRVYSKSTNEQSKFKSLVNSICSVSENTSKVSWLLYKLNQNPWREAENIITFQPEEDANVYFYRFIDGGEGRIIKNGKVEIIRARAIMEILFLQLNYFILINLIIY